MQKKKKVERDRKNIRIKRKKVECRREKGSSEVSERM